MVFCGTATKYNRIYVLIIRDVYIDIRVNVWTFRRANYRFDRFPRYQIIYSGIEKNSELIYLMYAVV